MHSSRSTEAERRKISETQPQFARPVTMDRRYCTWKARHCGRSPVYTKDLVEACSATRRSGDVLICSGVELYLGCGLESEPTYS
jgi:hypothetical protein